MTIYEIMKFCKNFFPDLDRQKTGSFTITNGRLETDLVEENQLFLIEGSAFNDGVHEYIARNLRDETFTGTVTPLCPPADFLELANDIVAWNEKNSDTMTGPFQSESFGGYSYERATDRNGVPAGWQDVFAKRLYVWRKI